MTWALLTIGHGLEVEGVEGLAGRQPGFGEMAFDAAAAALGHLVLGESGEEACGRPAFLVGLGGELGPDQLDGGQPQLGEEQREAGGVDGIGRLHAASIAPAGHRPVDGAEFVVRMSGTSSTVMSGMAAGSGAKRSRRRSRSGSLPASSSASMACGEFGLAGTIMGERQQPDHGAARPLLARLRQAAPRRRAISVAREELLAIDQVEQRHRLAAQGVDDVAVIDDMAMLAVGVRRPAAAQGHQCVAPRKHSSRSS